MQDGDNSTLISILTLPFPPRCDDMLEAPELISDIGSISLPHFSASEIAIISGNSAKDSIFVDSLRGLSFYFPYIPSILSKLLQCPKPTPLQMEYFAYFSLCSYVSWRIYAETTQHPEDPSILFLAILNGSGTPVSDLCAKVYIEAMTFFLKNSPPINVEIALPTLNQFSLRYPSLTSNLFDVYPSLFRIASTGPHEAYEHLLQFVSNVKVELQPNEALLSQLIEFLSIPIVSLDLNALRILVNLSKFLSPIVLESLFSPIPNAIVNLISTPFILLDATEKTSLRLPSPSSSFAENQEIIESTTFNTDAQPRVPPHFVDGVSAAQDCPQSLLPILHLISQLLQISPPSMTKFISSIKSASSDIDPYSSQISVVSAVLIILQDLTLTNDQISALWSFLASTSVCDPSFCSFDSNRSAISIAKLRNQAIEILANSQFAAIHEILLTLSASPLLFAEFFQRMVITFSSFSVSALKSSGLIKDIVLISQYFQRAHINADKSTIPLIESARLSLLLFISQSLSSTDVAGVWFSHSIFCSFFMAFLFEKPVRHFALEQIQSYLIKESVQFGVSFISAFSSYVSLILTHFPNESYISLLTELLATVNIALMHKNQLIHLFQDIIDSLFMSLKRLSSSPASHIYFVQFLQFAFFSLKTSPLTTSHISCLNAACSELQMEEFSSDIELKLIQLLAGSQVLNRSSQFFIKNTAILPLFIGNWSKQSSTIRSLQLISELLKCSIVNQNAAQKSGIDLIILDKLLQMKTDNVKSEVVTICLEILSMIHSRVASEAAVQKYFNFLAPIDSKHISIYQSDFLKFVEGLMSKSITSFRTYHSFSPSTGPLIIDGFTPTDFRNGFQISFWIWIEPSNNQMQVNLFSIKNQKGRGISLLLSYNVFLFSIKVKKFESVIRLRPHIPVGQWTQISFTLTNKNGELSVFSTISNESSLPSTLAWNGFKTGPLNVELLSPSDGPKDKPFFGHISAFAIFPQSVNVASDWISRPLEYPKDAVLSVTYSEKSGMISPILKSDSRFSSISPSTDEPYNMNFSDILTTLFKVTSLLPLFSISSLTTLSGVSFNDTSEIAVELLLLAFQYSPSSQSVFSDTGCIQILASLITSITYSLHLRLFDLSRTIQSIESRLSFVRSCILSFDILNCADLDNQVRITRHWIRVVFNDYKENFCNLMPLLSIARQICTINEVSQKEEQVCANLVTLASMECNANFCEDDFLDLLGMFTVTSDPKKIRELLLILESASQSSAFETVATKASYIGLLLNLIGYSDDEILLSIIRLTSTMHHKGYLKSISPYSNIQAIEDKILPSCVSNELVEGLLNILPQWNCLLPICCYTAICRGMESKISQLNIIIEDQPQLLWIICLLLTCKEQERNGIFSLLLRGSAVYDICILMTVVCASTNRDEDDLILPFLRFALNDALKNRNQKALSSAYFFLFYRRDTVCRQRIEEEFKGSPFGSEPNAQEEHLGCSEVEAFYRRIQKFSESGFKYHFFPRFKNGEWQDSEIGELCLQLYEEFVDFSNGPLNLDLYICAILVKSKTQVVTDHLKKLGLKTQCEMMHYLILKADGAKLELPISEASRSAAYAAIQFFGGSGMETVVLDTAKSVVRQWEDGVNLEKEFMKMANLGIAERTLRKLDGIAAEREASKVDGRVSWENLSRELSRDGGPWGGAKN